MSHQKKLEELNAQHKTVWDAIDRPIRPLIFQLNRIGLRTRFSCCGFPYRGEEEPKSHSKFPYVVINNPLEIFSSNQGRSVQECVTICNISGMIGPWKLEPYQGRQWYLFYQDKVAENFYTKSEGEIGIHDYEPYLIAIQSLARNLGTLNAYGTEFTIIDGNTGYADKTQGEWQVDPKKPVTFRTAEILNEEENKLRN